MREKTTAEKRVKNATENSEPHGKTVLTDLEKQLWKIKWVAVGECPKCDKELVRECEVDTAVCTCASAVAVDLTLAAVLPAKLERYFDGLAKQIGCTVDDVFNKLFEVGLANLEKRLEAKI